MLAISCGVGGRDRIEHASLLEEAVVGLLVSSGVRVTVQPGLVATRGDRYLEEVEPSALHDLHRVRSLVAAGVRVRSSSDAPYGPLDPWTGIAAAVRRTTAAGRALAPSESVDPMTALGLATSEPGLDPTTWLRAGRPADLAVLDEGWDSMLDGPRVALTLVDGVAVHSTLSGVALSL